MNWKKIFVSAVATGAIMLVSFVVFGIVWQAIFPQFDPMTIPGMRAKTDPLMAWFFLYPFVLGLAFAITFHFFEDTFGNLSTTKRGFYFGLVMWMLVTLPTTYLIFTSMDYGEIFLLSTTVNQLIEFAVAGVVVSWIFAWK